MASLDSKRWNCYYRACKSAGNTDKKGFKRTGTFPLTFTFADKHSRCYGNGLIDVAEKFEFGAYHAQYELSRISAEVRSSSYSRPQSLSSSSRLIREDRRRLCSQGICALERPAFWFKRFYYSIPNSLMLISQKYTSFWENCNKISFYNLPALKTSVDPNRIGLTHAALAFPEFLTLRPQKTSFFIKTSLLYDSEQSNVNIIEIHFIWGEL